MTAATRQTADATRALGIKAEVVDEDYERSMLGSASGQDLQTFKVYTDSVHTKGHRQHTWIKEETADPGFDALAHGCAADVVDDNKNLTENRGDNTGCHTGTLHSFQQTQNWKIVQTFSCGSGTNCSDSFIGGGETSGTFHRDFQHSSASFDATTEIDHGRNIDNYNSPDMEIKEEVCDEEYDRAGKADKSNADNGEEKDLLLCLVKKAHISAEIEESSGTCVDKDDMAVIKDRKILATAKTKFGIHKQSLLIPMCFGDLPQHNLADHPSFYQRLKDFMTSKQRDEVTRIASPERDHGRKVRTYLPPGGGETKTILNPYLLGNNSPSPDDSAPGSSIALQHSTTPRGQRGSSLQKKERHSASRKVYVCSVCLAEFKYNKDLQTHSAVHKKKYRRYSKLLKIMKSKSGRTVPNLFGCTHCNKSFTFAADLAKHIKIHEDHKRYEQVLKIYTLFGSLSKSFNILNWKPATAAYKKLQPRNGNAGDRLHPCKVCGSAFATDAALQMHLHHPERPLLSGDSKPRTVNTNSHDPVLIKQTPSGPPMPDPGCDESAQDKGSTETTSTECHEDSRQRAMEGEQSGDDAFWNTTTIPHQMFPKARTNVHKEHTGCENMTSPRKKEKDNAQKIDDLMSPFPRRLNGRTHNAESDSDNPRQSSPEQAASAKRKKRGVRGRQVSACATLSMSKQERRINSKSHETAELPKLFADFGSGDKVMMSKSCNGCIPYDCRSLTQRKTELSGTKATGSNKTSSKKICPSVKRVKRHQCKIKKSGVSGKGSSIKCFYSQPSSGEQDFPCSLNSQGPSFLSVTTMEANNKHARNTCGDSVTLSTYPDCDETAVDLSTRRGCSVCSAAAVSCSRDSDEVIQVHRNASPTEVEKSVAVFTKLKKSKRRPEHICTRDTFACRHCTSVFDTRQGLNAHQRVHIKAMPYCCTQCTDRFHTPEALEAHNRLHLGSGAFSYVFCNTSFPTANALNRHLTKYKRNNEEALPLQGVVQYPRASLGHLPIVSSFHCPASFSGTLRTPPAVKTSVKVLPGAVSCVSSDGSMQSCNAHCVSNPCHDPASPHPQDAHAVSNLSHEPVEGPVAPVDLSVSRKTGTNELMSFLVDNDRSSLDFVDKKKIHNAQGLNTDKQEPQLHGSLSRTDCKKRMKSSNKSVNGYKETTHHKNRRAKKRRRVDLKLQEDNTRCCSFCADTSCKINTSMRLRTGKCQNEIAAVTKPVTDTGYLCTECQTSFPDPHSLDDHLHHSEGSPHSSLTCFVCPQTFACYRALGKHSQQHSSDKKPCTFLFPRPAVSLARDSKCVRLSADHCAVRPFLSEEQRGLWVHIPG